MPLPQQEHIFAMFQRSRELEQLIGVETLCFGGGSHSNGRRCSGLFISAQQW